MVWIILWKSSICALVALINKNIMKDVEFVPNDKGAFIIEENGERIAEMIVGISGKEISVYHTEVIDRLEGQGIGTRLIESMVDYAKNNNLNVIPLCPFVHAKFKEAPEKYAAVWNGKEK